MIILKTSTSICILLFCIMILIVCVTLNCWNKEVSTSKYQVINHINNPCRYCTALNFIKFYIWLLPWKLLMLGNFYLAKSSSQTHPCMPFYCLKISWKYDFQIRQAYLIPENVVGIFSTAEILLKRHFGENIKHWKLFNILFYVVYRVIIGRLLNVVFED